MEMSIADLLKYKEQLVKKLDLLDNTIRRMELTKITQRVIANTTDTRVVEETTPLLSADELTSARDAVSKEVRLVSQVIEKFNHTTMVDFNAQY